MDVPVVKLPNNVLNLLVEFCPNIKRLTPKFVRQLIKRSKQTVHISRNRFWLNQSNSTAFNEIQKKNELIFICVMQRNVQLDA
jgi:hypothetical protein